MRDYTDDVTDGWATLAADFDREDFGAGIRLMRVGRLVERAIGRVVTANGLRSVGDYEVLATLRRKAPEPLQPATLAAHTMISPSGMTGRLDRLEEKALLKRRPNATDRRVVDIFITPEGITVAEAVFADVRSAIGETLGALRPSDRIAVSKLLRPILVELGDTVPE